VQGIPSASNAKSDIHAVYHHLLREHTLSPGDVVLYGQSVGSGPTVSVWWDPASHQLLTTGNDREVTLNMVTSALVHQTLCHNLSCLPLVCTMVPCAHDAMPWSVMQAWLAAKEPKLAGVILHSPILSGMRVLYPGVHHSTCMSQPPDGCS